MKNDEEIQARKHKAGGGDKITEKGKPRRQPLKTSETKNAANKPRFLNPKPDDLSSELS
ncbi:MAG: hypothetical protein ACI81F_002069 [Thalassolituus oleivorans]